MRKILSLLTISLLVLFASCDLNQIPEFDDSNAFVAFDKAALSIKEDGQTIKVPVTLASLKGISETVSFTLVDGTAKAGVNFQLASASTSLTFTATERTQFIDVTIIDNPGVFTGDLRFTIKLADDGKIKPSAESVCTVTITDNDHPLSMILGAYNMKATSHYDGPVSFDMVISKDPKDVTVVWFANICGIGTGAGIYGTVNEAKTEISVPIGQIHATNTAGSNGDGNMYFYGIGAGPSVVSEGTLTIKILDGGAKLHFETLGVGLNAGGAGFYEILYHNYFGTKI